MSELAIGQREVNVEESLVLAVEEQDLVLVSVKALLMDILKVSGPCSLNSLIGELVQNATKGLELSAKPISSEVLESGEAGSELKSE